MIQWKNIKVTGKMLIGFGLLIVLTLVVAMWSILGITQIVKNAEEVVAGNRLDSLLAEKEVDHLNWAAEVNALLTDDSIQKLNVQMDDHQCAFGKWLYGPQRAEAEALIPSLGPLLKSIEAPHFLLHESARKIDNTFIQADRNLPALLADREIDHLNWANEIRDALLRNDRTLSVETDHTRCGLGKWLNSKEAQDIYNRGNSEFKAIWNSMLASHEALHSSAVDLNKLMAVNQQGAKSYFNGTTLKYLETTLGDLKSLKKIAEMDLSNMTLASSIYSKETQPQLKSVQSILKEIRVEARSNLMTDELMMKAAASTRFAVGVITVIAFFISLLMASVISKGICGPMTKGIVFAGLLSKGDLTADINIDQKDEIGQLVKSLCVMRDSLRNLFQQVQIGINNVAEGSLQLNSTSQQLSQGASEQASSVEEISSSMEEMGSTIEQNSDNSDQTDKISQEAAQVVEQGGIAVMETVQAMKDISAKISIIEEIARSTNMLSLNAAIEAARAGEHGKGFAVVAAEVGKLAVSSKAAASEISELASKSVKQAIETGELMQNIVPKIKNTASLVQEIAASSKEQRTGATQVLQAINQLDSVIQQNASSSEESAAMAEELSAQAETLQELISYFKLDNKLEQTSEKTSITKTAGYNARVQTPVKKPFVALSKSEDVPVSGQLDPEFEDF